MGSDRQRSRGDRKGLIDFFYRISSAITAAVGTPWALILAFSVIAVWLITGPIFNFSDTWQLFINTGTTIVTFLMVFLIQATQNREAKVTQLKLDELIRAITGARNSLIDLEERSEDAVERQASEMRQVAEQADEHALKKIEMIEDEGAHQATKGTPDRGTPSRASRTTTRSRTRGSPTGRSHQASRQRS